MNNESIYLDTNVIMDFLLNRDSSAFNLIMKTISCQFCIVISDMVIKELHYQGLDREMKNLFTFLTKAHKLYVDKTLDSDHIIATELIKHYRTHYSDALHKVIAKRNNVRYLVTKNIKDFNCFKDIIVMRPEEL